MFAIKSDQIFFFSQDIKNQTRIMQVLSKGFNYIPSRTKQDLSTMLLHDFHSWCNRVLYIRNRTSTQATDKSIRKYFPLRNPMQPIHSLTQPTGANKSLTQDDNDCLQLQDEDDGFRRYAEWTLMDMKLEMNKTFHIKENLSPKSFRLLRNIKFDDTILIVENDKGNGLSVITKVQYDHVCNVHLSDRSTYIPFGLKHFQRSIASFNTKILQLISNHGREHVLQTIHVITLRAQLLKDTGMESIPSFYALIKLHKMTSFDDIKIRPIVNNSRGFTKVLNFIVHDFLAKTIPLQNTKKYRILKSTSDFIQFLNQSMPNVDDSHCLLTCDINSLYTNMSNKLVMQKVDLQLVKFGHLVGYNASTISLIQQCIDLILQHSFLTFNNQIYKQVNGYSMGVASAPTTANVFLAEIESGFISNCHVILYARYIDDVFMFVKRDKINMIKRQYDATLKLNKLMCTWESNTEEVKFLDLIVSCRNGTVKYRNNDKINGMFICASSFHADRRGFIVGELIRLRRNNQSHNDFKASRQNLYNALIARGYSRSWLKTIMKQDEDNHTEGVTHAKQVTEAPKATNAFVTTYNHLTSRMNLSHLISKHWKNIEMEYQSDANLEHRLPKPIVAYRLQPNLKALVTSKQRSTYEHHSLANS